MVKTVAERFWSKVEKDSGWREDNEDDNQC